MEVYKQFKKDLFWVCIIFLLLQFGWKYTSIGRDNTDGESRSGVALRIDAQTGCEYLEGRHGGLTPRLDKTGKHICR